jgi:hypothetical protein
MLVTAAVVALWWQKKLSRNAIDEEEFEVPPVPNHSISH